MDRAFGEDIEIRPKFKPNVNGVPQADPARPIAVLRASSFNAAGTAHQTAARLRDDSGTQGRVAVLTSCTIAEDAYAYPIRRDDQVIRALDQSVYAVAQSYGDGFGRIVLVLTGKQ